MDVPHGVEAKLTNNPDVGSRQQFVRPVANFGEGRLAAPAPCLRFRIL